VTALDNGDREEILDAIAALIGKLGHKPDLPGQMAGELASLREEIASLRQQVAAQHHGCCHHGCWYFSYPYPITTTVTYPYTITASTGSPGAIT
jgi:hypothetical protein